MRLSRLFEWLVLVHMQHIQMDSHVAILFGKLSTPIRLVKANARPFMCVFVCLRSLVHNAEEADARIRVYGYVF